jgi:Cu-processing system permease protein
MGIRTELPDLAHWKAQVKCWSTQWDAARTGALLAIEGTAAFGAASLALLRFTGGVGMAAVFVVCSLAFWTVAPLLLAARSLSRADV